MIIVSFAVQEFLSLMQLHLVIFAACAFDVMSNILLPGSVSRNFPLCFFSSLMVSDPMFKSLIYLELIFVSGIRWRSNFIPLYMIIQFSQNHLLKRLGNCNPLWCSSLENLIWQKSLASYSPWGLRDSHMTEAT